MTFKKFLSLMIILTFLLNCLLLLPTVNGTDAGGGEFVYEGSLGSTLTASNDTYSVLHALASASSSLDENMTIGQVKSGSSYSVFRSVWAIDTSDLPATAAFISAQIEFAVSRDESDKDFNLIVYVSPDLSIPNYPFELTDFAISNYNLVSCGSVSTSQIDGGYVTLDFSNMTIFNRSGITTFILMSSLDSAETAPAEGTAEIVEISSGTLDIFADVSAPSLDPNYTTSSPSLQYLTTQDSVQRGLPLQAFTWSLTATDQTALGYYIFSSNITGSWANDTAIAFAGSTEETVTVTKTLPEEGNVVQYIWYANDTLGYMSLGAYWDDSLGEPATVAARAQNLLVMYVPPQPVPNQESSPDLPTPVPSVPSDSIDIPDVIADITRPSVWNIPIVVLVAAILIVGGIGLALANSSLVKPKRRVKRIKRKRRR